MNEIDKVVKNEIDKAVVNEADKIIKILMTVLNMNLIDVTSRSQRKFKISLIVEFVSNR